MQGYLLHRTFKELQDSDSRCIAPYPLCNVQEIPIFLPPCQHLLLSLCFFFFNFYCRHPCRHKAESHCGCDLHLFSVQSCWTHFLTCLQAISMPMQVLYAFCISFCCCQEKEYKFCSVDFEQPCQGLFVLRGEGSGYRECCEIVGSLGGDSNFKCQWVLSR